SGRLPVKKLLAIITAVLLALGLAGIAMAADGDLPHTGRVIFVTGGDVQIAVDEQADAVVVISGDAEIAGTVNTLFVVDGTATVTGGTLETVGIVNGTVALSSGTTITGDLLELNSTVERGNGVEIGGEVKDIAADVAGFAVFMGFAALAIWIGFGIATILIGLLVAGLAARQTRSATSLITHAPGTTFLVGLLAMIVTPLVAGIAMVTIIGIPAGLGLLLFIWPTAALMGYIVAAIWLGEWLLGRSDAAVPAERPYAAATIGLLAAFVLGLIPIVTAVVSLFGLGAVVLAAWRTLRRPPTTRRVAQTQPTPA
ncbi:MAG TPA: hypothetical protein VFN76_01015, partial [Candidatus Limnocylindria bacterium]|nr:hypothetical protein [Candidatus Limnocylindria bacterium]